MSTIKLEIEVSAENVTVVSQFLQAIAGNESSKIVAKIEVVDAEEVRPTTPVKAPTPRPSRAKPKAEPVVEEEEETEEDEDFSDDEPTAVEIDADDIRAVQATKVDKHREAIKAQLKKLGATGIRDLDPDNFKEYYDFLAKLK